MAGENHELNSKYLIEIDGIRVTGFEKCTVGDSEFAVGESRTGIDPNYKDTFSGLQKPVTVTLEKIPRQGKMDEVMELINWHRNGSSEKKTGSIILLDRDGNDRLEFIFYDAWISKMSHPEFDAESDSDPARFTFELTASHIDYK